MQCAVSRETSAPFIALLALVAACNGSAPEGAGGRKLSGAEAATPMAPGPFLHQADARTLGAQLRTAAVHADPSTRLAAVRALARLRSDAAAALLTSALLDHSGAVRIAAAHGLAAQQRFAPATRRTALAGAVAAEPDAHVRGSLLEQLARVPGAADPEHLRRALDSPEPGEQAGACRAHGASLRAGRGLSDSTALHLLQLAESGPDARRRDCLDALAELRSRGRGPERPAMAERLGRLAQDPDSRLRRSAIRALGHFGGPSSVELLVTAAVEGSPIEAPEALRALHSLRRPAALLRVLARLQSQLQQRPMRLASPRLAALLLAHELLVDHREHPVVRARFESDAVRWPARDADPARVALARAQADCAAAELQDHVRKWPSRVERCGIGHAPEWLRQSAAARVLARVGGSDDVRAAYLGRLMKSPAPEVRAAALTASASLPPALAAQILVPALEAADPEVMAAALRTVALSGAALQDEAALGPAIERAAASAAAHPASAVAWLGAVRALGLRGLSPTVEKLAATAPRGVWEVGAGLLSEWKRPTPPGPRVVARPLDAVRFPSQDARFHVQLRTTAGTVEIALDTERAPVAALQLVRQARGGQLDGTPVARLIPGVLVGLGLEAATTLRHEDAPVPIERGSVLVEDLGRDALTGRLMFTLGREPAFDGRFTRVGKVTRGMEVLESIHALDRVKEARVVVGPPGEAPSQKEMPRRTGSP